MSGARGVRWRGVGAAGLVLPLVLVQAALLLGPGAGTAGAADNSGFVPSAAAPNPYSTGEAATLVLGDSQFGTTNCGTTNATFQETGGETFDRSGDLWVADLTNNRVLEFTPPFRSGMGASLVLGQSTFTTRTASATQNGLDSPGGLAVDSSGDLWVGDETNNRVVEFVPPFTSGMNAYLVLGQTSFTTRSAATSQSGMISPYGLAFTPSGDLTVADVGNNRVLVFEPPFSTGENASIVLGQSSFTTSTAATTATGLSVPLGVAVGPSGELFVGDLANSRVVGFPSPYTNGMAATLVLGQANFTYGTGGLSSTRMSDPLGVAVSSSGALFVGDEGNNRVVEFLPPFSNGQAASVALGQPGFVTATPSNSSRGLSTPFYAITDAQGNLWTADTLNCRVVEYAPPHFGLRFVETGLPAGTLWSASVGGAGGASSSSNLTINAENGTYSFQVSTVSGYRASPSSGTVSVNGSYGTVYVTYSPEIAGVSPAEFALGTLAAVLVVALAATFLVLRRRGRGERRGVRPAETSRTPPPTAGGPPPGVG